jgi:hypothetical protein
MSSTSETMVWFVAPRAHIGQADRSAPPAQGVERTNADRGRPRERSRRQSFEHHAQLPRVVNDGPDGVAIFDDGGGAKPVVALDPSRLETQERVTDGPHRPFGARQKPQSYDIVRRRPPSTQPPLRVRSDVEHGVVGAANGRPPRRGTLDESQRLRNLEELRGPHVPPATGAAGRTRPEDTDVARAERPRPNASGSRDRPVGPHHLESVTPRSAR